MSWTMIEDNRAIDALLKPGAFLLAFPMVIWGRVFATGRVLFASGAALLAVLYFVRPEFSSGAEQMAGTSVVSTTYGRMDTVYGGMGVLGPTRMDYPGTIASVAAVALYIGEVLGAR